MPGGGADNLKFEQSQISSLENQARQQDARPTPKRPMGRKMRKPPARGKRR